jgi:hypothetical protein
MLILSCFTQPAFAQGTILTTQEAVKICNIAQTHWVDFCNGLVQGYADYAVLSGGACIPNGTTRTTMVTLFASNMASEPTYQGDEPAIISVGRFFSKYYPCR